MIEGVAYGPCGFCDTWYSLEEQCWSYDLQAWVCGYLLKVGQL